MDKRTVKQEIRDILQGVRQKWQDTGKKEKIALAAAGAFLLLGFCIFFAPKAAKQLWLREQEQLTTIILADEESADTIEIVAATEAETLVFYDSDAEEMDYFGEPTSSDAMAEMRSDGVTTANTTEVVGLGILEIEKIGLNIPVAEGATTNSLKIAAGHVRETAAIGQEGNAVVAAHRSYTKGEFFNRLDELTVGDPVVYTSKSGVTYRFEVINVQILEPSDGSVFDVRAGKCDLTLYTCTPVRVASHRLAVRCTLVEKITYSEAS